MDDLTGRKFGRLTVQSFSHKDKHGQFVWHAVCECGTVKQVSRSNLMGKTKSCGCLKREVSGRRTHGLSGTSTHRVWKSMMARCYTPSATGFKNYGGRGIGVCDRWRESYVNFLADMGERPEGFTIERINVNGPYNPDNCRWATRMEQGANKRNNVVFDVGGERLTMAEAAKAVDIPYDMLRHRVSRGWSGASALARPKNTKHSALVIAAGGERLTIKEWASRLGMSERSVRLRIASGWSDIDAVTVPKGAARQTHLATC